MNDITIDNEWILLELFRLDSYKEENFLIYLYRLNKM